MLWTNNDKRQTLFFSLLPVTNQTMLGMKMKEHDLHWFIPSHLVILWVKALNDIQSHLNQVKKPSKVKDCSHWGNDTQLSYMVNW